MTLNSETLTRVDDALTDWNRTMDEADKSSSVSDAIDATECVARLLREEEERAESSGNPVAKSILAEEAAAKEWLAIRLRLTEFDNAGDRKRANGSLARAFRSLERFGKTERGVPRYTGSTIVPTKYECFRRVGGGVAAMLLLILFGYWLTIMGVRITAMVKIVVLTCTLIDGSMVFLGISGLQKRRFLDGLVAVDDAERQFGVPQITLILAARQRGIEPRCVIDGREFFAFSELGEAATLLRVAEAPSDGERLLRAPRTPVELESALVRAASAPDAPSDNA